MSKRFPTPRLAVFLLGVCNIFGQPEIHMKSRASGHATTVAARPELRLGERRHWLIQFGAPPVAEDLESLRLRGARLVSPAPEWGFVISGGNDLDLGGLNLAKVEPIVAAEKISPNLTTATVGPRRRAPAEETAAYIVEFHPDVEPSNARRVLLAARVRLLDHAQLLEQHYLVEASSDALERLSAWDEVAYVFPASTELLTGAPVTVCYGAVTETGPVGQSIALVGPGWAPGRGAARLNFALGALSVKLEQVKLRGEIMRAMAEWSKYVAVDFAETAQLTASRTLAFRWGRGTNGGPLPFDGPGRMLAYTYYPAPPNPEPTAGDLYFDDDENWQIGADIDAFSVILHEIGHALGLGHSDNPVSVMYPYYRKAAALSDEDVAAIRLLYASRVVAAAPPPTPVPAPAEPTPSPETPVAPAPEPPSNPTPTLDRTPPVLTITSPLSATVLTSQASIRVTGTASDSSGVAKVGWSTAISAGTAQGTAIWTADVPLIVGVNSIKIQAWDPSGNSSWRSVVVTRR